ncbi:MAG: VWA domain-containing protein [Candidatus Thorarchaeota archaeon]
MIVVEDIEANEIHRFVVVDSSLQLGIVRAGQDIRTFDPDRAFSFYSIVENQLNDFAALYPGAFRYLPRRAYDYLRVPRLLSEFYHGPTASSKSSWIADYLVAKPLINLGETVLPALQQDANATSINRWATQPPQSPRLYHLQDMRSGRRTEPGWGCVLRTPDLPLALKGPNRNDLLDYIKTDKPVFIELGPSEELDPFLEWLVLLKQADLKTPRLVLGAKNHKEWGQNITRLLDVPGSKVLTSGATISSLSTLVRHMRKAQSDADWSKRLLFSSAYPETQFGDSISEIFSYLLSRNLAAEPEEIQRILGGNILSILPPRPAFLQYDETKTSVVAEESLGKAAMNELARILQILDARNMLEIVSLDHMIENDGGSIYLDSCILTLKDPTAPRAMSLAIQLEKNGSVLISGWKKAFSDSLLTRDGILLATLVRANAKLEGPIFDSPAHLTRFDKALLSCLQIEKPSEILSALHFGVEIAKSESGTFFMCENDMSGLEVTDGDHLLALDINTGQWCAGVAKHHARCGERSIVVSEADASLFGFQNSTVVNLVRYEGEIVEIDEAVMSYYSPQTVSNAELASFMHLHEREIRSSIRGVLMGIDTRLHVGGGENAISMRVKYSKPQLLSGHVGRLSDSGIDFKPQQAFGDFNVVLCISKDTKMKTKDVSLKTIHAARTQLEPLIELVPEVGRFIEGIKKTASRAQIAALSTLMIVNTLLHNRTEGKLALVTFNEIPEKFSIQRGSDVQSYVEFYEDLQSEEVLISLIYSIIDAVEEAEGYENLAGAYRSIAEYLEDFGPDRPTVALVLSNGAGTYDEEHISFLSAISKHDRYRLDILTLGKNGNQTSSLRLLKGLNSNLIPIETFSSHTFTGYLLDLIDNLVSRTTDH